MIYFLSVRQVNSISIHGITRVQNINSLSSLGPGDAYILYTRLHRYLPLDESHNAHELKCSTQICRRWHVDNLRYIQWQQHCRHDDLSVIVKETKYQALAFRGKNPWCGQYKNMVIFIRPDTDFLTVWGRDNACMRQWSGSTLLQTMACRLVWLVVNWKAGNKLQWI